MPHITLKCNKLLVLLTFITSLISCSSDKDLLLETILENPENAIENIESINETPDGLESRSIVFEPTNDAYLQGTQSYNLPINRLEEGMRTSYLKFDLSQIPGTITNASLEFIIDSDEGNGTLTFHKGSTTDWTEQNLSPENAPDMVTVLGTMNKTFKIGTVEKVNITSSELNNEITSFIVTHQEGNDLAFASKESTSNKGPKLVITYEAPIGSDEIQQEASNSTNETTVEETTTTAENTNTTTEETTTSEETTTTSSTGAIEGALYVTTNGSASNDGKSEASAWSIDYAFAVAKAGDVVYIKAGFYGNQKLIADNSGTAGNPIKFIGYQNTPGDINSSQGSTFSYGDEIDSNQMPHLQGYAPNNEGQGTAIRSNESFIHIENIQISHYEIGVFSLGNYSTYKNIIISQMGDYNPAHKYPDATSDNFLNYSGLGIILEGNGSELLDSFVLNCGAQGITIQNATNVTTANNEVYGDDPTNPIDYYFLIGTNTKNSNFNNTTVFRSGALLHLGHGIVVKGAEAITGNVVDGFEITNTFLEVQFPKTTNNTFKNGTVIKQPNVNSQTHEAGGLRLANGARYNHYEDITLTNCSIKFSDWNDGLAGDVNDTSDYNTFKRIEVKDSYSAIAFSHFLLTNSASAADNNTFTDCTFKNVDYLFEVDRANSGTKLINCSVDDVRNLEIERMKGGDTYSLNATYDNCSWSNIGFTKPD